jgi:dolichol kinase
MCTRRLTIENGIELRKYANDIIKELFRKSIHLCASLIPFFLYYFHYPVLIGLSIILVLYIVSEILRRKGIKIFLVSKITEAAARKRDEDKFVLGPVTLTLGILVSAFFFNPIPATIGIYALAFGDGLASLVGKMFGKTIIPYTQGKTVAGSLACFTAIFISASVTCENAFVGLVVACIGTVIELLPLKDFDNLIIPVLIATICQFYFHM